MGWVRTEIQSSEEICKQVISVIKVWRGLRDDSVTPYEFFVDYLRDNFDLTLHQCDEVCKKLKAHYGIGKFYFGE